MASIRERLLSAAGKRRYESATVKIDGEDQTVWFTSLSGEERDAFEASILAEKTTLVNGKVRKKKAVDTSNIRAKLVAATACESDGNPARIFTNADIEQLGQIDGAIVDALWAVASKLAGMSDADVDELAGN